MAKSVLLIILFLIFIGKLFSIDPPQIFLPKNDDTAVSNVPTFCWTTVSQADKYTFQYSNDKDFIHVASSEHQNTCVVVNCLSFNSYYYCRVNAKDGYFTSNWSPVVSFKTMYYFIPSPSELIPGDSIIDLQDSSIVLSCNVVENADLYGFQIAIDSGFTNIIKIDFETQPTYKFSNLQSYTKYYWRCQAIYCNTKSEWSRINSFSTSKITNILDVDYKFEFNIYPNPATDNITISFLNPVLSSLSISIYNSLGIAIKSFDEKKLWGISSISFSTHEFSPGVYYCTLRNGINKFMKSFVVLR
jgi:hypothetical protein